MEEKLLIGKSINLKKIINKKVLLITNIPTPYRIPLFNCIYSKLKSENIDFLVVFANKTYPRRKWQIDLDTIEFNYYFLNSEFISLSSEKSIFTYKGINKLISQFNPDVVISNGFTLSTIRIIIQRIFFYNYKLIIWSGAIERYKQPIGMLREILRKFIVKRVDRFIVYGSRAKDYIVSLGGNSDKIDISYNTIDSFSFKYMNSIKTFNEKTKILFVGHLTKGKNIESLLPVLKKISIKYPLEFILVGDGPERRNLKDLSEKLGISKIVKFEGFKQQSELSKYYLDADIFVFPSNYDIWGLVVIEAMVP